MVGRFIDALEHWAKALALAPDFAMALGNRGMGLHLYARHLYDRSHAVLFRRAACRDLDAALTRATAQPISVSLSAKKEFERNREVIAGWLRSADNGRQVDLSAFALGRGKGEQRYRSWCLTNVLFLNPLNDLGKYSIAARDILHLPDHKADFKEPPTFIGFFNQLKQEFATVRYLYYDGTQSVTPHFADRDVRLFDTLDYSVHSLAVEKVRLAFRSAYSIFDKIAIFLSTYLKIPSKKVNFRTLW